MAQRPTADFNIDPNVTSGTDLANILNRFQDAIDSGNSGGSRPAYLAAGGLWVREGDPMRLYLYDGTTDRELYNTTDGIVGALEDGTVDGQITTWDESTGAWTPEGAVVVDSNGNVGIGTDSPSSRLHTRISGNVLAARFDRDSGGNGIMDLDFGGANANLRSNNAFTFSTGGAGVDGGTERMRIDASGNVGIGQNNPSLAYSTAQNLVIGDYNADKFSGMSIFSNATDGEGRILFGDGESGTDNRVGQIRYSHADNVMAFSTNAQERMTIDANGKVLFPQLSIEGGSIWRDVSGTGGIAFSSDNGPEITPLGNNGLQNDAQMNFGRPAYRFKNGYFSGTVTLRSGVAVGSRDFIETLKTLRDATKDETTLEGLRDAIGDAIGGLIQKFEALQAEAKEKLEEAYNQTGTQEITPDKGTKDDKPEAGTMDD